MSVSAVCGSTVQAPDYQLPIEAKESARKDSFELIPLEPIDTPVAQSPVKSILSHASSISAAPSASLLDMQKLSSTPPDVEVLEHVLSGSSAFDHSHRDDLSEGAAELIGLSEEPSGQYEGSVLGSPLLAPPPPSSPPLGSPLLSSPQTDVRVDDEEDSEIEVSETDNHPRF
jgi:hypothetical protein